MINLGLEDRKQRQIFLVMINLGLEDQNKGIYF